MSWVLSFDESPPGLNDKGGLLRTHWQARRKIRDAWAMRVLAEARAKGVPCPVGKARVTYTRWQCGRLMDWDNCGASFKLLGDALVSAGVLVDDSPEYLIELRLKQGRVKKRTEAGCSLLIELA